MITYDTIGAFNELTKINTTFSDALDINEALGYMSQCNNALMFGNSNYANKVVSNILNHYSEAVNWFISLENSFNNNQQYSKPLSIWNRVYFIRDMIPFYVMYNKAKTDTIKKLIKIN